MFSVSKNLSKTLIFVLLFIFSISIIYHCFNKEILEGLENPDSDDEENDGASCQATPAKNSGQIEFIRNSLKQLQAKVENNTKELAKLSEEKEQVKKNTKMINHNSKAILKATGASKLAKKQNIMVNKTK